MKRIIFLSILLSSHLAFSQEIVVLWDSIYSNAEVRGQKMEELILLGNGRLAGAGRVDISDTDSDGLFFVINPDKKGELEFWEHYGGDRKDGFHSLAQAEDKTFYLVGYSNTPEKQQAWIKRIRANGNPFPDIYLSKTSRDELQNITWLGNGTGVILGQHLDSGKGHLWLMNIRGETLYNDTLMLDDTYADIRGMELAEGQKAWIFGYAGKSDIVKKGELWLTQIDKNGVISKTEKVDTKRKRNKIYASGYDYSGNLLLAGEIADVKKDPFVIEISPERELVFDEQIRLNQNNKANSVLKSFRGERWVTVVSESGGYLSPEPHYSIVLSEEDTFQKEPLKIIDSERFQIKKLLEIGQDTFIIAGTMQDKDENDKSLRVVCVAYHDLLVRTEQSSQSKGGMVIDSPYVYRNFRISANNKEEFSEAKGTGYVEFDLTNQSGKGFFKTKVTASWEQSVKGINLVQPPHTFIYSFHNGDNRTVSLGIDVAEELDEGEGILKFTIESEGVPEVQFTQVITISSQETVKGDPPHFFVFDEPTRELSQNHTTVTGRLISRRRVRAEEIKYFQNGKYISIGNTKTLMISLDTMNIQEVSDTRIGIPFSIKVSELDTGLNVVNFEVEGFQSRILEFEFEPLKPNLHLLAIGPQYGPNDIRFPGKDAEDVVNSLLKQKERGFFKKIMDPIVLNTSDKTTKREIENAFERLYNRRSDFRRQDYLFVFISGHGHMVRKRAQRQFRFQPTGFVEGTELTGTVDYESYVLGFLDDFDCKVVVFVDACHSGGVGGKASKGDITDALIEAHKSAPGLITFTSCTSGEKSYENRVYENGIFTEALLEAMDGSPEFINFMGSDTSGLVTVNKLYNYLQMRVPQLLDKVREYEETQSPQLIMHDPDFNGNLTLFILK